MQRVRFGLTMVFWRTLWVTSLIKKVYCKLCDPPFAVPYSTNTSNLTYHLQRQHPEEHKKVIGTRNDGSKSREKSSASGLQQATIFTSSSAIKPYPRNSKRAKQLVQATGKFIAQSLQPVNIVDEPSFRMLLSQADARFELPHRTHFATKVIPQMYVTARNGIEEQLKATDHCTITTDLWTASHQRRLYISLTVHFVDTK